MEDQQLVFKKNKVGDVETDEPMGVSPWVEDEGIKTEDVIG